MDFANPHWLKALIAVPFIAVLFAYGSRRRQRDLGLFTGPELGRRLAPGASWRKNLLKSVLKLAGITLLILALAGPRFGSQLVKVEREGIDLVIALDTSLSMLAEDMKPNRLERAKQEIIDLIGGLRGDRVGVVVFAGDASIICPLTVDYDAALMFTQAADIDMVSKPGSALGEAIGKSMSLFKKDSESDRVIILVTDGESHDGDPVSAAQKAADDHIRIYTIGIGNPNGELIPLRGTGGSVEGYKKDGSGEAVLTRLDEKTLRQIATATGGQYLPATREGLELTVLYREISGLEQKTVQGEFIEQKQPRFPLFLAFSFLVLGVETVLTRRGSMRIKSGRRILHTGAMGIVLALLVPSPGGALAGTIDRGRVKSGNQYYESKEYQKALALYREALGDTVRLPKHAEGVLYNEANALHMLGDFNGALRKYQESFSEDSTQAGRTLYNRGNTLVAMNKLPEAIESYVQALRYLPDDEDARLNLELALRRLEEQQQQQQQQQEGDEQNEKGDQQKQQQQRQQGESDQRQQDQEQQQQQSQPDSTSQQQQPPDSLSGQAQQPDSIPMIMLSKEDALRILQLLDEQEKELQKQKRKAAFKRASRTGKDW